MIIGSWRFCSAVATQQASHASTFPSCKDQASCKCPLCPVDIPSSQIGEVGDGGGKGRGCRPSARDHRLVALLQHYDNAASVTCFSVLSYHNDHASSKCPLFSVTFMGYSSASQVMAVARGKGADHRLVALVQCHDDAASVTCILKLFRCDKQTSANGHSALCHP